MVNLPVKGTNERVEGVPDGNQGIMLRNSNGYVIARIYSGTQETLAHEVARLVTQARDAGFAQGLASIRNALGLK